jgi:hypothetical protein
MSSKKAVSQQPPTVGDDVPEDGQSARLPAVHEMLPSSSSLTPSPRAIVPAASTSCSAPPPAINDAGGGEEGKLKMIVGLLKKFMGVKVCPFRRALGPSFGCDGTLGVLTSPHLPSPSPASARPLVMDPAAPFQDLANLCVSV